MHGRETVKLAPGNYAGTITLQDKTYSSTVTLTSQDLNNPAVFTTRGIEWTNVRRFAITGLEFRDSRTDATRVQDGSPVAATSAIGMKLFGCRDGLTPTAL